MTEALERHFTATAYIVSHARTLLMWHRKAQMWLPPGGHCEANEDPVEAALREAVEESGLTVVIVPSTDFVRVTTAHARPIPPPAAILIEDIETPGQPLHQHIDHVYFTSPGMNVDLTAAMPGGEPFRWLSAAELADPFSLPAPDGTLVPVAEDVRLLGIQAIATVEEKRHVERPIHP